MSSIATERAAVGRLDASATVRVLYVLMILAGMFFVLAYGYPLPDPMPREATWLMRTSDLWSIFLSSPVSPLVAARTVSLVVAFVVLTLGLRSVLRASGWYGAATCACVVATSPILATMSSSATPDVWLFALLVLPTQGYWARRMARQGGVRSMGVWCFIGLLGLLGLGLSGMADVLCGKGKIENAFTNNDPFHIGLSMIMTGCAVYTVMVATALGVLCQRWGEGTSSPKAARWWERGLTFVSIRIPIAALLLAIYRMVSEYQAMERVHIITACAWVALVLAIAQVRLRHWEGQFFPIVLVAIAFKVVWVHAIARERDLERGSAILARAVARALPEGASFESRLPMDSVFAYTLWSSVEGARVNDPAGHLVLEGGTIDPAGEVVARFSDPRGESLALVRRSQLARAGHDLSVTRR